jgi:hypothetical protein
MFLFLLSFGSHGYTSPVGLGYSAANNFAVALKHLNCTLFSTKLFISVELRNKKKKPISK